MADRAPTPAELARMQGMIARAMGDGAWGISTGLKYLPGAYSETPEVVALSRVAADSGGIYTSHLREEGLGLIASVAEAIRIGRDAGIPIVLTHHKAVGQPMWGASARTLAMLDSARAARPRSRARRRSPASAPCRARGPSRRASSPRGRAATARARAARAGCRRRHGR